jgi:hydroxymethylpyrimidine/phosphomethylpyrimidine kinase
VQNTKGVSAVHPVPVDIIAGQIEAVLSDIGADAIKTGMLASTEVIDTVIAALDAHGDPITPLVVDPVMVATSGDRLIDEDAVATVRDRLLPRAALITPNAPEAEALTGGKIDDMESQQAAAEMLLRWARGRLW